MFINKINFSEVKNNNINNNINKNFISYGMGNNLNHDLFSKSTVSFAGKNVNQNDDSSFGNKNIFIININKINQSYVKTYLDYINAQKSNLYKMSKTYNLQQLNEILCNGINATYYYFNDLLNSSNINSVMQLLNFTNLYNSNKDAKNVFNDQNIEALKIYGILNNKHNLVKFPDILLHLYKEEETEENPDFNKLNETMDFLSEIGIKNSKDIDTKLYHLKDYFNDFNTPADKTDAIKYIQSEYKNEINLLDEILKNNSNVRSVSANNLYKTNIDVIDYIYLDNNGENLGDLNKYIDIVIKNNELKPQTSKLLNSYTQPEEKIELYRFLNNYNITPSEANALSSKLIISDVDNIDCYKNYNSISNLISELKGISETESKKIYTNFKDVINSVINEDDNDGLEKLLKVIDKFGIKKSAVFLDYYNKIFVDSKKRSITSEEFKNMLNLLNYSENPNIFRNSKKQNMPVLQMLLAQKQQTELCLNYIDDFLSKDNTGYFSGMSAEEIYNEYKDLIISDPNKISNILQKIIDFNIQSSENYKEKTVEIDKFEKFFPDKSSLFEFFKNNKIKFNENEQENLYRQNCLDVLNSVWDENNIEKSQERINYFSNSKFFLKSKKDLNNFVQNVDDKQKVFSAIADKKVPNVQELLKYAQEDYQIDNVIEFISSLPKERNFNNASNLLENLQKQIKSINLSLNINNENISAIDSNLLETISSCGKISVKQLNNLFKSIYNTKDGNNIITTLPNALKEKKDYYTKYRIAVEIANNINKSEESYNNIAKMLNLGDNSHNESSNTNSQFIEEVKNKLPQKFVSFVNSADWLKYNDNDNRIPNLSLHAKLRLIDRFALPYCENINSLYSPAIKNNLKNLLKTIYASNPQNIKGHNINNHKRILVEYDYDLDQIETIFDKKGQMITIFKKD